MKIQNDDPHTSTLCLARTVCLLLHDRNGSISILLPTIFTAGRVMMTSSNGNIFRVAAPLCGKFIGHRWIPLTKANDAEHARRQSIICTNAAWNIVNWTLRNKLQWNFNRNSYIFIQENPFENIVWKMAAILSRPQCVKVHQRYAHFIRFYIVFIWWTKLILFVGNYHQSISNVLTWLLNAFWHLSGKLAV